MRDQATIIQTRREAVIHAQARAERDGEAVHVWESPDRTFAFCDSDGVTVPADAVFVLTVEPDTAA